MVSETVRRQIAERERQQRLKDEKPEISGAQAAVYKADMASLLLPGESVSRGMKRLRPPHQHKFGMSRRIERSRVPGLTIPRL